jgi:hypothetical protein
MTMMGADAGDGGGGAETSEGGEGSGGTTVGAGWAFSDGFHDGGSCVRRQALSPSSDGSITTTKARTTAG